MQPILLVAQDARALELMRSAIGMRDASGTDSPSWARARTSESSIVMSAATPWALELLAEPGRGPVLIASYLHDLKAVPVLMEAGADGFLTVPAPRVAVEAAVHAAEQIRAERARAEAELMSTREQLQRFALDFRASYERERSRARQLADSLERLEGNYMDTVRSLAAAVEAKDPTTGRHIERVSRLAQALAETVDPELAEEPHLAYGFLLHDVGKIGVPDRVLLKPGPLTDEEYDVMRRHAVIGARILEGIEFLRPVHAIIRHHHERWDGRGYPDGLAGEDVPRAARIFSVADAADAMLHDRPYRPALSLDEVRDEVAAGSGTQFDPEVVEAFVSLVDSADSSVVIGANEERR